MYIYCFNTLTISGVNMEILTYLCMLLVVYDYVFHEYN